MKTIWLIVGVVLFGAFIGRADAALVKYVSTGVVPSTGLQIAHDAMDPQWRVAPGGVYGGEPLIAKSTGLPSTYVTNASSTASRWVGIDSDIGLQGISVPKGIYTFEVLIDLTGYVPSTAKIPSSRITVDDFLVSIHLNGSAIFTAPAGVDQEKWTALPPDLGLGNFVSGVNTLSVVIDNFPPSTTPLALRFEGVVDATPIPEPTISTIVIATAAILLRRRWR